MKCKKCGTEFPNGMKFCPFCGRAYGKAKLTRTIAVVTAVAGALILISSSCLLGIGLGTNDMASIPKNFSFMQTIADKIKDITAIPIDIALTEQQINDFIQSRNESFKPVDNLKFAFHDSDNAFILSGSLNKSEIQTMTGGLPAILLIFLPEVSTIRIDAQIGSTDAGLFDVKVTGLKIADVQLDASTLSALGVNEFLSSALNDAVSSYTDEKLNIEKIEIAKGNDGIKKIRFKGSYSLKVS